MPRSPDLLEAQHLARLDKLADAALADTAPCDEPRHSRTRGRVIIPVQGFDVSIPLKQLDAAIEIALSLSDGVGDSAVALAKIQKGPQGALQTLLDALLHARQKYGRTKKLRGKHHGKEEIYYTLKYAAAWTYDWLAEVKPKMANLPAVVVTAERELNAFYRKSNRLRRSFEQRVRLTAILVKKAYGGPFEPLTDKFIPENWYRDYVKPYIRNVRRIIRRKPLILYRRRTAYLRDIFPVNGTFKR